MKKLFDTEFFNEIDSLNLSELAMPFAYLNTEISDFNIFGNLQFSSDFSVTGYAGGKYPEPLFMTTDTVRQGTDTSASISEGTSWTNGTIDAEPISGDGETSDLQGGFVDKDWYRVTLSRDHVYEFEGESRTLTTDRVAISLYDSNGVRIEGIYGSGSNFFVSGENPTFTFPGYSDGPSSRTYYLAVSASDTNNSDFRTATGDFRVRFTDETDTVREGTDTNASLSEGNWTDGTINAEPIVGDEELSDGAGGFVDKDWYEVTLSRNHIYEFEGDEISLTTNRMAISLYDSNGDKILGIYDNGSNEFADGSRPSFTYDTSAQSSSTQTYYLAVSASSTNSTDFLTATGDFEVRFQDLGETDNVREGTDTSAFISEGTSWTYGEINAEPIQGDGELLDGEGGYVDKDWYEVSLETGRLYEFDGDEISITTDLVAISLYDSDGQRIQNIYGSGSSDFASGTFPTFTIDTSTQNASSQTYYLAVSASSTNNTDFLTATGEFRVRYTDDGWADDFADDLDDTRSQNDIGTLIVDSSVDGTINAKDNDDGTYGDKDVFLVSLTAGHSYTFTVDGSNGLNDAVFSLRDSSFTMLGNLSNVGDPATLNYTVTETANYYVRVGTGVVDQQGDYELSVVDNGATQSTIEFSEENYTVNEAAGVLTITLNRDQMVGDETVYVSTFLNGEENNGDYTPFENRAVTFEDGNLTTTFDIIIGDDTEAESTQTFRLQVQRNSTDPIDTYLDDALFTIIDDDNNGQQYFVVDEDFNDGIMNGGNWNFRSTHGEHLGNSVSEHDGYLDIRTDSTDNGGYAEYTFSIPVQNATIEMSRLYHSANDHFFGRTLLFFQTESGETVDFSMSMLRSAYAPDYLSDSENYDHPRFIFGDSSDRSIDFIRSVTSSSLYDIFIDTTITVDNENGFIFIDLTSDGIIDGTVTDSRLINASLLEIGFDGYGWHTGHYTQIDSLQISTPDPITDTVLEGIGTNTSLSEGADWTTGIIDEEPIEGNGVTEDGQGGFVDKDWFEVTLNHNRNYIFEAEAISITTGQVFIRLYDSNGNAVYSSTHDEGTSASFDFATGSDGGTYYLAISASDDNASDFRTATGEYRVRFQDEGQLDITDTVREGTDTTETLLIGNSINGVIDQYGIDGANPDIDKDWYAVDLVGGQNYTFTGQSSASSLDAVAIRVYNSSGVIVSTLAIGDTTSLNFVATDSGQYYLAISAAGSDWQNATGSYSVSVVENNEPVTNYYIVSDNEVDEADGQFNFNISRTGDLSAQLIYIEVLPTSGFENIDDYTPFVTRTFYFEENEDFSGDSALPFFVDILDDNLVEGHEQFTVRVYTVDGDSNQADLASTNISIINDDSSSSEIPGRETGVNPFNPIDVPDTLFNFPLDNSTANSTPPFLVETGLSRLAVGNFGVEQFNAFFDLITGGLGYAAEGGTNSLLNQIRAAMNDKRSLDLFIQAVIEDGDLSGSLTLAEFIQNGDTTARINKFIAFIEYNATTIEAVGNGIAIFTLLWEMIQTARDPENAGDQAVASAHAIMGVGLTMLFPPLGLAYAATNFIPVGDGLTVADVLSDVYRDAFDDVTDALGDVIYNIFYAENSLVNSIFPNSEALTLGDSNDEIILTSSSDVLYAGGGNDIVESGGGADYVFAESGDDLIKAASGPGDDYYDGGADTDTVSYESSTFDLIINLDSGTAQSVQENQRWEVGTDTLVNIENVIGGQADDQIIGNADANELDGFTGSDQLFGLAGNDTLLGDAGDDALTGGAGADVIDGGAGVDTAAYAGSETGVAIDLAADTASGGDAEGDSLTSIENIIGSDANDILRGDNGDNELRGGLGADLLVGREGADVLDGGAGFDSVDYRGATARIVFDVIGGGKEGDAAGDTFIGIERYYLSDFNDIITGSDADEFFYGEGGSDTINAGGGIDRLYGGDGNDIQRGQAGNDLLFGSAGTDQLNGGVGFDIVSYDNSTAAVEVNMLTGGTGGDAAGDTYFGIEAVYGSDFDDVLTGNNSVNELRGGDGDDTLDGSGGNDRLYGNAGADAIIGGVGIDSAYYTDATAAVTLDLATGGTAGDAAGDSFSSIEWVFGSDFDDDITGDSAANRLYGEDGNDTLNGEGGNDRILGGEGNDIINGGDGVDILFGQNGDDIMSGGAGNDFFYGGAGSDSFDGGDGFDTVNYLSASSGVSFDMTTSGLTGEASGDTYISIERVLGTGFDDAMRGSAGDDVLLGNGGDDYIDGGAGNDSLNGGAGIDSFGYSTNGGDADVISGFTTNEVIYILGSDPTFDTWAEVQAVGSDAGANVIFNFGGGNTLTIVGQNLADLDASNFDFNGIPPAGEPQDNPDAFAANPIEVFDMDALI